MHEKKLAKAYRAEMGGALLIYVVLLVGTIKFGRPMDDGVARTLVLVSPMIGFGLAIWAVARHLRRVDEYVRQMLLECAAITAAVTAGLTFTYGFLETAGFPRLSMFAVWVVMGAVGAVVACVRALANR